MLLGFTEMTHFSYHILQNIPLKTKRSDASLSFWMAGIFWGRILSWLIYWFGFLPGHFSGFIWKVCAKNMTSQLPKSTPNLSLLAHFVLSPFKTVPSGHTVKPLTNYYTVARKQYWFNTTFPGLLSALWSGPPLGPHPTHIPKARCSSLSQTKENKHITFTLGNSAGLITFMFQRLTRDIISQDRVRG